MNGDYQSERDSITARYSRRDPDRHAALYSPLSPSVYLSMQERERSLIRILSRISGMETLSALEIGCGSGGNLAELIKLGFAPEKLTGIDLLPERIESARRRLPSTVALICGDATCAELPETEYGIIYLATVFSSILDNSFQELLARRIWSLLKPGGSILIYDFIVDNPKNRDVRGMPVNRIRSIFPYGRMLQKRITLAPPISRFVTRIHPSLYTMLNVLPFLRTHVFCEIRKSDSRRAAGIT